MGILCFQRHIQRQFAAVRLTTTFKFWILPWDLLCGEVHSTASVFLQTQWDHLLLQRCYCNHHRGRCGEHHFSQRQSCLQSINCIVMSCFCNREGVLHHPMPHSGFGATNKILRGREVFWQWRLFKLHRNTIFCRFVMAMNIAGFLSASSKTRGKVELPSNSCLCGVSYSILSPAFIPMLISSMFGHP